MALELLSGPNVVTNVATGVPVPGQSDARVQWIDPRGLFYERPDVLLGRVLIQMDGAAYVQGYGYGNQPGYYDPALVVVGGSTGNADAGERTYGVVQELVSEACPVYVWDRVALVEAQLLRDDAPPLGTRGLIVLPDRFIRLSGTRVQSTVGFGTAWADECQLPFTGAAGQRNAFYSSWADAPSQVWISNRQGDLILYDLVARATVGDQQRTGVANVGLFYSRKHRVFVSLHYDSETTQLSTRVWASTPVPASLAVPVAASAVGQGASVALSTQLLGASGEPCADEVVGWSVVSGDAALLRATSKTDASGTAHNTLLVAQDASGDVQVDVEAQV